MDDTRIERPATVEYGSGSLGPPAGVARVVLLSAAWLAALASWAAWIGVLSYGLFRMLR